MNPSTILFWWMAFFILSPVLEIGGHFIYLPELLIYALFFGRMFLFRPPYIPDQDKYGLNDTSFRGIVRAHIVYLLLFLATALFTAYLVEQSINNYDVFILRHILQVIFCLKLFDNKLYEVEKYSGLDRLVFKIILVLCVPALIVYFQRLDLFSFRENIFLLYKQQFGILTRHSFESYRYASIFKDFFTSAVYFTMLASFMFYFILKTKLGMAHRVTLTVLLGLVYGAQLFVARTSLVMIPLLIGAIALFAVPLNTRYIVGRLLPMAALVALIGFGGSQYLLESGLVNSKWAMEALELLKTDKRPTGGSLATMQEWNEGLLNNIFKKENFLFQPKHSYNPPPRLYTDSFYGQEIYRYGIYGMIAYLSYVLLMLASSWRTARYIFLLTIALAILNVKGGSTFFMAKNIYLYAFLLAVVPRIQNRRVIE